MDFYWQELPDLEIWLGPIIAILAVYLGAAVGLSFIPASMAKKKGYSFGGFYCLSLFVSFVVTIIIAAVLKDKNPAPAYGYAMPYAPPPYSPAPYGPVNPPYTLPPPYYPPPQPAQPAQACPACGAAVPAGDPFCAKCGVRVKQKDES